MDRGLLEAARCGELKSLEEFYLSDPDVLQKTPCDNTCLHIASAHGHKRFCEEVVGWNQSLLAAVNKDGETPLLSAVISGHDHLASFLLRCCRQHSLSVAIIQQQDKHSCNALHHAVSLGYERLALELIAAEPALSHEVNFYKESPMFIAVMRNLTRVVEKLLEIPTSSHSGAYGCNAMHAAVRVGNKDIAKKIMATRSELAKVKATIETRTEAPAKKGRKKGKVNVKDKKVTPVRLAVKWNRVEVLKVMLEHDQTLGYEIDEDGDGEPLLVSAAFSGHLGIAQEILKYCPDAPCSKKDGWTYLHQAVWNDQREFVEFIMSKQQLCSKLVNMRNKYGKTALHYAVQKCNPVMVSVLLSHNEVDFTMFDQEHKTAIWKLFDAGTHAKTLNWNEIIIRMMEADPKDSMSISNLHKAVKRELTNRSREDVRSLTQTYTSNTSLVAILMATITFAAAFTLPGGYSSDAGSEGLPIMARKFAFQAFLIFDTLAMCSSFAVAFICIIARWEDLEFLLYYRSFTKKLMWFAYTATTIAFSTGLYTVLAPRVLWLAVAISLLSVLLPILTKLLGEWPVLKLRSRLIVLKLKRNRSGSNSKIDFLDVV